MIDSFVNNYVARRNSKWLTKYSITLMFRLGLERNQILQDKVTDFSLGKCYELEMSFYILSLELAMYQQRDVDEFVDDVIERLDWIWADIL
jgi:hypothetical protein